MSSNANILHLEHGSRGLTGSSSTPKFVYIITTFASISGFLFGYDTGVIASSILLVRSYFHLDTIWTELVVTVPVGSAAIISICVGFLADIFGRRKTIMISSGACTIAGVIMCASPTKEVLLFGRIVVGIVVALSSVTEPMYVAEVAPANIRGTLVTLNQVFAAAGALVSSVIAGVSGGLNQTGWRIMMGLIVVPTVVQFVGFIFLPESPRWLLKQGYENQARDTLVRIRGTSDVHEELAAMRDSLVASGNISASNRCTLWRVFTTARVRRALWVGIGVQAIPELCGVNVVTYFIADTLKVAGFSFDNSAWVKVILCTVFLLPIFITMYLIDRLGRRLLLLGSIVGVAIALVILAAGFQLSSGFGSTRNVTDDTGGLYTGPCGTRYSSCGECTKHTSCGFCYDVSGDGSCLPVDPEDTSRSLFGRCNATDPSESVVTFAYTYCPNNYAWLPVLGLALYVLMFAPGLGSVPWTITSEIFPLWARGLCMAITSETMWVLSLLVSLNFRLVADDISKHGIFWLFAGMCVLGFLFVLRFLPETKQKTLEEMDQLFETGESLEEKSQLLLEPVNSYSQNDEEKEDK